jgi:hypothetical protein
MNSAERQLAQYEDGASLLEIYADLVRGKSPVHG